MVIFFLFPQLPPHSVSPLSISNYMVILFIKKKYKKEEKALSHTHNQNQSNELAKKTMEIIYIR